MHKNFLKQLLADLTLSCHLLMGYFQTLSNTYLVAYDDIMMILGFSPSGLMIMMISLILYDIKDISLNMDALMKDEPIQQFRT